MPTTKLKLIKIDTDSDAANGSAVVTNTANGEIIILRLNGVGDAVLDLNNFDTAPATGDVLTVEVSGLATGGTTVTIDGSKDVQTATINAAAYTPPLVNM